MSAKRIGVLVPAGPSADAAAQILSSFSSSSSSSSSFSAFSFKLLPISRNQPAEDVALAVVSSSFDGFLNLCHGRRPDGVSAAEVVGALEELCTAYYSGATPHSVKLNRSDVAALAFYAGEGNADGFVVPNHGTVRSCDIKTLNNSNNNNISNKQEEADGASTMVDRLQYPVSVRPNKYLRAGADDGAIIAHDREERLAAQRSFFNRGHAAVYLQEETEAALPAEQQHQSTEKKKAVGVSVGAGEDEVFLFCSARWNSTLRRSAVNVVIGKKKKAKSVVAAAAGGVTSEQQEQQEEENEKKIKKQLEIIGEKLYRGVFDDASCSSTLRGHCLIRLAGSKAQSDNSMEWRVLDIEPNCCLITPEDDGSACRAQRHIFDQPPSSSSFSLPELLASLIDFEAPPRYVQPAFKVEYDPRNKWYGLTASRALKQGEIVFADEATSFTLVTKPFVEANWSDEMKVVFSRYAWPVSGPEPTAASSPSSSSSPALDQHVYAIWSDDPSKWRPINHHCNPNLHFAAPHSLNCVAARDIAKGEMLTLDYAGFCDWTMKPFNCRCGSEKCRGLIEPTAEALAAQGAKAWHRSAPARPAVSVADTNKE